MDEEVTEEWPFIEGDEIANRVYERMVCDGCAGQLGFNQARITKYLGALLSDENYFDDSLDTTEIIDQVVLIAAEQNYNLGNLEDI